MGLPLLTVAGISPVARAGVSQLTNLGLRELIATSPADFVRIGADLATDLPRLRALRRSLRQRMQESPLMDVGRFASDLEALYQQAWHECCWKHQGNCM